MADLKKQKARPHTAVGRAFNYDVLSVEKDKITYVEHVTIGTMTRGDYFGGRGLLTEEEMASTDDHRAAEILKPGPARLSVVIFINFCCKVLVGGFGRCGNFGARQGSIYICSRFFEGKKRRNSFNKFFRESSRRELRQ